MSITDTNFTEQNKAKTEEQLNTLLKKIKQKDYSAGKKLAVLILAAGLGKRMKSPDKPKVMFEISGRPMIHYVAELSLNTGAERVIAIVGNHKDQVIEFLNSEYGGKIEFAYQEVQLGTGHAVMQSEKILNGFDGEILILSGDVPLLKDETVKLLLQEHFENGYSATLLTTEFKNASGYGRILRDENGNFLRIVEDKDATEKQKEIHEINPAIYVVSSCVLFEALKNISPQNTQKEYYLTDIFNFIPPDKIGTLKSTDEIEVTGVNSVEQLAKIEKIFLSRNLSE